MQIKMQIFDYNSETTNYPTFYPTMHPTINPTINPTKKITTVFQPHLFSRTNDFMGEFANALALSNKLYLLDIYPARELPMEGVTSQALLDIIKMDDKQMSTKKNITSDLQKEKHDVIVILGAGDIDTCINPIVKAYE